MQYKRAISYCSCCTDRERADDWKGVRQRLCTNNRIAERIFLEIGGEKLLLIKSLFGCLAVDDVFLFNKPHSLLLLVHSIFIELCKMPMHISYGKLVVTHVKHWININIKLSRCEIATKNIESVHNLFHFIPCSK